jgi:hypothetical protein
VKFPCPKISTKGNFTVQSNITDGDVCTSSEYALARRAKGRRINFFIKKNRWGIELIWEGDWIKEHGDRFKMTGAYGAWTGNGEMADYMLLD